MSIDIPKNRGTLIELKNKKKLYEKGQQLLKKKLDGLVFELYQRLRNIRNLRVDMQEHLSKGYNYLENYLETKGLLGIFLNSLSPNMETEIKNWKTKSLMGVRVFDYAEDIIKKEALKVEDIDLNLAKAKEEFSHVLETIIKIAKEEDAIRKILEGIKKTKRKKLFLENKIIPAINEKIKEIKQALGDQMREEIVKIEKIMYG